MFKITRHPSKPVLYASGEAGVFELADKTGEVVRKDAKSGPRLREVILGGVSERIGTSADGIAVISNDNSPG
jgi:hypothetical protein